MPEATVIANPTAAAGQVAGKLPQIREALRATGLDFTMLETYGVGHATLLAQEAIQAGSRLLIAVGGDGTWNEMVNGSLRRDGHIVEGVELGLIPCGTTNNFSRSAGIPVNNISEAARRAVFGHCMEIDLGLVEYWPFERSRGTNYSTDLQARHRYFTNIAALGFEGELLERGAKFRQIRARWLAGLVNTAGTLWNYQNKSITLQIDNWKRDDTYAAIIVANGQYGGSNTQIVPHANLSDGRFNVLLIGDAGKLELIQILVGIRQGTHLEDQRVQLRPARFVGVKTTSRMVLQLDGEAVGLAPVSINIIPAAICVRV